MAHEYFLRSINEISPSKEQKEGVVCLANISFENLEGREND